MQLTSNGQYALPLYIRRGNKPTKLLSITYSNSNAIYEITAFLALQKRYNFVINDTQCT